MNAKSEFKKGRQNSIKIFDDGVVDFTLNELKIRARKLRVLGRKYSTEKLNRAYWLGRARGKGDLRRRTARTI